MFWTKRDQLVCKLISDGKSGFQAPDKELDEYRGFFAALLEFEKVGIITGVDTQKENHTGKRYISAVTWTTPPSMIDGVKTPQRRWMILRFLAAMEKENHNELFSPDSGQFFGLAGSAHEIERACQWLSEEGFIKWSPYLEGGGVAHITDKGHEALEHGLEMLDGKARLVPPLTQHVDQSVNFGTFHAGQGDIAIGPGASINKKVLADEVGKLIQAIQQGKGSPEQKQGAIAQIKAAFSHPMVTTLVGTLLGAAVG
tara:strand:- start:1875 stop:2642 length:768 start_codon:yes stop_codon:yes gene_type:complete